jgi:hypothetical protein
MGVSAGTFIDDFEDAGRSEKMWTALDADWKIEDGKCIFSSTTDNNAPGALLLDVLTEDKMEIEVSGMDYGTGTWKNLYIIFAYLEDEGKTYLTGALIAGAQWTLQVAEKGAFTNFQVVGGELQSNKEYTIKIAIDDDTAILYVDDEEVLEYTFPDGMPIGRIGFGQLNAEGEFDYFRVDAPSVIATEPAGKLTTTWGGIKGEH